jgi:hypothetical protein
MVVDVPLDGGLDAGGVLSGSFRLRFQRARRTLRTACR